MKTYGGVGVSLHTFLTSASDVGELSVSRPGRFTTWQKAHGTHWAGGCINSRVGLDAVDKRKIFCPCRESNSDPLVVKTVASSLCPLS
jgi:hypothetical protein